MQERNAELNQKHISFSLYLFLALKNSCLLFFHVLILKNKNIIEGTPGKEAEGAQDLRSHQRTSDQSNSTWNTFPRYTLPGPQALEAAIEGERKKKFGTSSQANKSRAILASIYVYR